MSNNYTKQLQTKSRYQKTIKNPYYNIHTQKEINRYSERGGGGGGGSIDEDDEEDDEEEDEEDEEELEERGRERSLLKHLLRMKSNLL